MFSASFLGVCTKGGQGTETAARGYSESQDTFCYTWHGTGVHRLSRVFTHVKLDLVYGESGERERSEYGVRGWVGGGSPWQHCLFWIFAWGLVASDFGYAYIALDLTQSLESGVRTQGISLAGQGQDR